MAAPGNSQISFAFMELRELLKSFDELEEGCPRSPCRESAIYQLVDHLGEVAMPTLLRKLVGTPDSGRWASLLLLRLAQDEHLKKRICLAVREQSAAPGLPDRCRLLAADLLATLSAHQQELPFLAMPEETAELSLVELAECMSNRAEVARAVDILIGDLPPLELIEFVEDFAEHQPGSAHWLLVELLLRDDLDLRTRTRLRQIHVSVSPAAGAMSSTPRRVGLRLASHTDGRTALVCYARIPEQATTRYRAICLAVGVNAALLDCQYLESVTRSEIDRQLLSPLVMHGYQLSPIAQAAAKEHALAAIAARRQIGLSMPSDYYLGRDLLGLFDEHCQAHLGCDADNAALLARGTELMNRDQLDTARDLLVRYAELRPDDSEAMATLGACLMKRGELERARSHLARAAWLAPQVGRHHWNRASLAHHEGRLGDCFLALKEYLRCMDSVDADHRSLAEAFVADYTRRAALQAPVASAQEIALREASLTSPST